MEKKVLIIGTMDTKKEEYKFVQDIFSSSNIKTILMNTGVHESPITADISSNEVAEAGGSSLSELRNKNDRGTAVTVMTEGAAVLTEKLINNNKIAGIFGMGGTAGTTIVSSAMRKAPVGLPKLLISTVASGNTRPYVGEKDIMMNYSVVDISGINSLSSLILENAANALIGMVSLRKEKNIEKGKPMIGITMFGVTTPAVTKTREILESKGYDVLVFHATGAGGDAMETLIEDGFIKGVVDITTTELADNLVGGIFRAKNSRLEKAGKAGIPQIISVGALDMVNFGPPETVPEKFKNRKFYQHNPTTTLMRTTVEENVKLGEIISNKLNQSNSPTLMIFPKGGVSLLDKKGEPFEGAEQREALLNSIKVNLREDIPIIEVDEDINDVSVSEMFAEKILTLLEKEEVKNVSI